MWSVSAASFAEETGALVPPAPPTAPAPAPVEAAVPSRKAGDVWNELDAAMKSINSAVDKKKFETVSGAAATVKSSARWLVENPPSNDADYVRNLGGTLEHLNLYAETLGQEAAKGNAMTMGLAHRKLGQMVESLRTAYNTPPAEKKKEAPKPQKVEKVEKVEKAPEKPEVKKDEAPKTDTAKSEPAKPAAPAPAKPKAPSDTKTVKPTVKK